MKCLRLPVLAAGLAVCGTLSASDKTISGNYTVAAGGESYDNVTVTATATISGGPLAIADGGTIAVSAGTASFTCPVTMGTSSSGTVTIAPAAGATADFTGKISGPADIEILAAANSGVVKFTSSDSDYDGNLLLTKGTFHAKGDKAFGSTAGYSTFTNLAASGACVYFDGFTTSEHIVLSQSSPSVEDGWHIERVWFTADCTFNGAFTDGTHAGREWGWNFTNGITVSFNGSFSGFGSLMGAYSPSCTATINFNCSPTYSGTWYWQGCILNMRARRSATDAVRLRGGTYNFYVDRHFVWASDNWVPVMIFETADAVTFNLINGEQQFVRISENKSGAACVITSASGQTFKLLNTGADSTFAGKFTGDVNFSLQGDRTVTLTGKSDTTGTLVLSNTAKVVFADGSFWGGRLVFQSGDGSQLITLNNGSMAVSELKIGGVKMPDGVYGSSASSAPAANQLSCFAGSGIVKVQGGLVVNGSSYQVAAGGETYTSVIVSNNATITGGPLTVLDGGRITVAAGKTAAFQSALTLGDVGNSKVVIAPEAGATADFTGKISGLADIDIIAAANSGVVKFTSSESDYDGNLLLTKGTFHAKGNAAFGSTAGSSTFTNLAASGACVYFDGFTTSEQIVLSQSSPSISDGYGYERVFFTSNCTFNGVFKDGTHKGREWGWNFNDDVTVDFNGEFSGFQDLMGAKTVACKAAVNFNCSPTYAGTWFWMGCVQNLYARRSGTNQRIALRGGTYNFHVANHFVSMDNNSVPCLSFETPDAVLFNLVEGEQTFSHIWESKSGAASMVASESGQTFRLANTASGSTFAGRFSGNVNLCVNGTQTVTLSGQSDTTGELVLSNSAKVVFAPGGRWTGKVAFQDGTGGQTLTLDNGGMTVSELWVDGERLPDGDYGSSSSGVAAENQKAFLGGSGVLTVGDSYGVLVINGATYDVAAAGETYTGVIVSNNATVTGGRLTVLDGGTVTVSAGKTVLFANDVALGRRGNYDIVLSPESGATNVFAGAITGASDIQILAADQSGSVQFVPAAGKTSDFDGDITVTRGTFHAAGDSALGSTAGHTYFVNTFTGGVCDNSISFDGMTTSETIYLSRGTVGWIRNNYPIRFTADCTFNGPILPSGDHQEFGWYFADGITLDINGGLGTAENQYWQLMGSESGTCAATIVFNSSPYVKGTWYWANGTNVMNRPLLGNCSLRFRGGFYRLNCENAFVNLSGSSKSIIFENSSPLTFDLVTGSQKFSYLAARNSENAVFTSGTGQDVHLDASSGSYAFHGRFTGNVGLKIDAAQTLTLSGASTSTGTLALTNGAKVVFSPTGSWAGNISVAGDGGEKIFVSNIVSAAQFEVGGRPLPPGYYGPGAPVSANRISCLEGSGLVVVGEDAVSDGVWSAGAGGGAPGIDLGANWASGTEPDGSSGLAAVTFARAGVAADVTHDVFWNRIVFSQDVPMFRVAGGHAITLGNGVSVDSAGSADLSYEIAVPVTVVGNQSWTVPAKAVLTLSGDISGAAGTSIACGGAGTYVFSGANSDFASGITLDGSASIYPRSSKALGGTAGATTLAGSGNLILNDLETEEPFVLRNASDGMARLSLRPGTNVLNGPVSVGSQVYIGEHSGGDRLVFAGGLDFNMDKADKTFQIGWFGSAAAVRPFQVEITGTPITNSGSHNVVFYNEGVCDVIFSVAGNRLTGTGRRSVVQMTRNDRNAAGEPTARLFCKVPYVFDYDAALLLGYAIKPTNGKPYCGLIDLCGNDQGFAAAYGHPAEYQSYEIDGKPQGAASIVTSSGGAAFLCSRHADNASTWWTFNGAAGYRMEGTGGITFRTSSESTGALCVTNGTMTIPAGVTWKNCSRVVASDNGTFHLEESRAFGSGTEVRLSGNGTMNLASGVQATAGFLFLDGNPKPLLGEWGSAQSGAAHTSAHFTGTGRIRFGSQMIIIFR